MFWLFTQVIVFYKLNSKLFLLNDHQAFYLKVTYSVVAFLAEIATSQLNDSRFLLCEPEEHTEKTLMNNEITMWQKQYWQEMKSLLSCFLSSADFSNLCLTAFEGS